MQGWPEIASGDDVLISAPTGSGKTLAAFLICLDELVARRAHRLAARRNPGRLCFAAQGAQQRRSARIWKCRSPRSASSPRSRASAGADPDRGPHRRHARMASAQQMGRKPPHILVTTPESLFILLTAERSRADAAQRRAP